MWRLVMSERGFDYNTVFHRMSFDEIEEANIALDLQIAAENKAVQKNK